jgi:hypothetical protein
MNLKLILVLVVGLSAANVALAQSERIFRTVTIAEGKTITLGDDFANKADLFEKVGAHYRLKKGLFGGAEEIRVFLNRELKINAIDFLYDASKDFGAAKKSYMKSLGTPSSEGEHGLSGGKVRRVSWEDAETRFHLVEVRGNGKVSVSSTLFDKKAL